MPIQKILRICLGFIFLWPFFDKLLGLGISTSATNAWINGVSPTAGFLSHARGPLAGLFQAMSGSPIVDWLFMLGLLGIGLALILGIGMKIACYSGVAILTLIYFSMFPPTTNPLIDDHVIYSLLLISFILTPDEPSPLAKKWHSLPLVKKYPVLR